MASRAERLKIAEGFVKKTHFTLEEVQHLQTVFSQLNNGKKVDRNTFRVVLHKSFNMTDDMLMDRAFRALTKNNENLLGEDDFITGLSVLLRGTLDEQIHYCFAVYDLNGDGHIQREEMFVLLKQTIVKPQTEEDRDEGIKDLVDLVLKKMDQDHDGRLSLSDFETSVRSDALLLEAFGPCIPSPKLAQEFLSSKTLDLYANKSA